MLGTCPQMDFFPLALKSVSWLQCVSGERVKVCDTPSKFSVKVTLFCGKPKGTANSSASITNKNFFILNNLN